ncbi:MAG: acyl-CoA carboxylase subunit epsilon [Pseudonocardiaceae bacterium]|nr:acyl-CoA carboxylase subunit epsilon [Pseudonocardiaceae bacterium]
MTERPLLRVVRVVRGEPSDDELAALTAVVAAAASQPEPSTSQPSTSQPSMSQPSRSAWADPAHRLRAPLRPGPGAWRASALPR